MVLTFSLYSTFHRSTVSRRPLLFIHHSSFPSLQFVIRLYSCMILYFDLMIFWNLISLILDEPSLFSIFVLALSWLSNEATFALVFQRIFVLRYLFEIMLIKVGNNINETQHIKITYTMTHAYNSILCVYSGWSMNMCRKI